MRDEHNTDDLIDLGAVSVETKGGQIVVDEDFETGLKNELGLTDD